MVNIGIIGNQNKTKDQIQKKKAIYLSNSAKAKLNFITPTKYLGILIR